MKEEKNLIVDKSFEFALKIVGLHKMLIGEHEYMLSKQVLRSGASIGANVEEALAGHSKKDFLTNMIISNKEARETRYWLRLIDRGRLSKEPIASYLNDINDIMNILSPIIITLNKNLGISLKNIYPFYQFYYSHSTSFKKVPNS